LNLLISPVLLRGTIVISSPCWSMTCTVVSPGSAVTVWPAWLMPTWMHCRATWMPPRLDTFRWTVSRAAGSGSGPARRTPLDPLPLVGRNGAGKGAPQDAVLGNDVHDLAVQADAGSLPG
jgi:hypothetical protein